MIHGWQYLTPQDRETILQGILDGQVYGGPYHLELDWVDKCNANCFFCNSEYIHDGESIPWERAIALLEEAVQGGLHSIRLCGGGEPTLHPRFPELLQFLAERRIILDNLTTNGTNLTGRAIEALMGVRVSDMRVSLNFPTAETYAAGMGLPERFFGRVVEMTRALNEARQGNPNFGQLVLQFYVYKPTVNLIRQSYELGRELGADVIVFRELWGIDPALHYAPEDLPTIVAGMREVLREDWREGRVASHLESHGIGPAIGQVYEELRAEFGEASPGPQRFFNDAIRYCYIGWYSMTITGSQAVYPCCNLLPLKAIPPLGNLAEQSLAEVWRGPAFAEFRKEMRDYFILQRQVPLFDKRVKRIGRSCATHNECVLTRSLCDEAFYEEADRRLESQRHQPGNELWRFLNRTGRFLERKLR